MDIPDWLNLSTAAFDHALRAQNLDPTTRAKILDLVAANAAKTLDTEWEQIAGGNWTIDPAA